MTTRKLVPVEPTEVRIVSGLRFGELYAAVLDAAPNQGRVSREQLATAAHASSRYFFRKAMFLADRWTVEDRLGIDEIRWFDSANAAEMCRNELNARAVIAALGLETEGE